MPTPATTALRVSSVAGLCCQRTGFAFSILRVSRAAGKSPLIHITSNTKTKMKRTLIITAIAALVAFTMSTPASAGPNKRTGAGQRLKDASDSRKAAEAFDKNGDHAITGDEVAEFRKAFEADKTGPLKEFDLDHDGKLSDEEIAKVKLDKRRRGK